MKAFKRIFAAATLLVTTGLASEVNAQVPLEDFFKNPEKWVIKSLRTANTSRIWHRMKTASTCSYRKSVRTRQPELLRKQHVTWQEVCGQMVIGFFT